MYKKIVVSYNESPEAQRAFTSAISLARVLGAELQIITVMADLPSYTAFAGAADPSLSRVLREDRIRFYEALAEKVRKAGIEADIEIHTHIAEGPPIETIVRFVRVCRADLLVIGLHQRDLYIARLWSTVYELAQEAPCSVLGVH
jgi:nucleotide-binding universal stress UspA family protein